MLNDGFAEYMPMPVGVGFSNAEVVVVREVPYALNAQN